jgi:carbamate kinase
MRIVVALGGNALSRKGEVPSALNQRENVKTAARALAPVASKHELIISHGNGPQVGMLALQAASYNQVEPYPLDILGAETEGMIGYMIEQELGNLLPFEKPFATILTMVEVDEKDPAYKRPSKPIGPVYGKQEADKIASSQGWTMAKTGKGWRRVVPSPHPKRIFEIRPIKWLLEKGAIVICAGGGGIPTAYDDDGNLRGADVVIDKDRASALLAAEIDADLLILATDVDGVYRHWGTSSATKIDKISPDELQKLDFSKGSMGPKVEAACFFVDRPQRSAVIGAVADLEEMVFLRSGTIITDSMSRVHGTSK